MAHQDLNLDLDSQEQGATAVLEQDQAGELVDAEFQVVPDQPEQVEQSQPENGQANSISDSEVAAALDSTPATPAITIDPRAEMAREIENLQKEVAGQACEVARRAGGLKSAKKEFDGLVEELRDLERRFDAGDYGLAFDPAKSAGDSANSNNSDVPAGTGADPLPGQKTLPLADPSSPDELAWRSVALSEIGLSGKLLESLEEAGLKTMGALADYTAAGKLLTDISGIGTGKAEKIEKACEDFWASRTATKQDDLSIEVVCETKNLTVHSLPAKEAGAEDDAEVNAYAAGCEACIDGKGPESNPHKQRNRLWQMFDRGWQDTNAQG